MKTIFYLLAALFPGAAHASDAAPSPGRGEIPNISQHYHASPLLYQFEQMPLEQLSETISRQYIYGGQSMLVKWIFKKGAVVPLHHHLSEQITWITKGSVKVNSQGKEFIVKAGEVIVFPPNVPHEFIALEDTIDIDIFAPARQDWIDGTSTIYNQFQKK